MQNTNATRTSSMLGSLLSMLFVVLKLLGVIHWTWLWVLSPFWIVVLFSFLFIIFEALFSKNK